MLVNIDFSICFPSFYKKKLHLFHVAGNSGDT